MQAGDFLCSWTIGRFPVFFTSRAPIWCEYLVFIEIRPIQAMFGCWRKKTPLLYWAKRPAASDIISVTPLSLTCVKTME